MILFYWKIWILGLLSTKRDERSLFLELYPPDYDFMSSSRACFQGGEHLKNPKILIYYFRLFYLRFDFFLFVKVVLYFIILLLDYNCPYL